MLYLRLGEPVLAQVDPWVATLLVLAPLGLHDLLGLPSSVQDGITLYIGISLLVAAAIGYGGCEVIAIPTAAFGRRYVVYCPYNAVERPLRSPRRSSCARRRLRSPPWSAPAFSCWPRSSSGSASPGRSATGGRCCS
jgi:Family of unknown function (DUF6410)